MISCVVFISAIAVFVTVCDVLQQRRLDSELERMLEGIEQKRVGKKSIVCMMYVYVWKNINSRRVLCIYNHPV